MDKVSREVCTGVFLSCLSGHSLTTFLQQVGLELGSLLVLGLLSASKLATSMATIVPGMIQYFFCIKLVFGWDENSVQDVTANLNIMSRGSKLIMTNGGIWGVILQ